MMRRWRYEKGALYFGEVLVASIDWNLSPYTDSWEDGVEGLGRFIAESCDECDPSFGFFTDEESEEMQRGDYTVRVRPEA
jgi:hypothetical protein